ncbi:MAG TPA: PKD domain-containing protein [Fulvivirga sp.]|nr:PKD domain-containing protein [Fulvivirga sp.]
MSKKIGLFLIVLISTVFTSIEVLGQCSLLRSQIDVSFNTDQDCAPVQVTDFTITYYFNAAQNPNDIEIRFEWNDPGNQISTVNIGNGLVAGPGNTSFTASAPNFTYFINNDCSIRPTAYIYINGTLCPTSQEIQLSPFWGTDEDGNGNLFVNPTNYDVCFNNPVVNAVFVDNSEFNCRVQVEPDRPNQLTRNMQFVYGTNHNPASTIINLSLEDGGTQPLTDASGNLVSPQTRGTAGLPVTGGYFGPIETIPTPALGPNAVSFPLNAPADLANLIGNDFEITLFNWNFCNPYNGDPLNPNYEDAIATTAYVVIIDSPNPDFITRRDDASGAITNVFCLGEDIYFDNETPGMGGLNFTWEFFDDNTGTVLLSTSTNNNPTFAYSNPGQKLIRLTASDPTAQGACEEIFEAMIDISPSLAANISLTDFSNNPIVPLFCQDTSNSQTFEVRFNDTSVGVPTANTRWRWEFYDETGTMIFEDPAAGAFSSTVLGPYDRTFNTPGVYRGVLIVKDDATTCESIDEELVYVYSSPTAMFSANSVCDGELTDFTDSSVINPINGESIVSWEWDFDYDGVTFNKDPAFDNQTSFSRSLGGTGSYDVALRVTSDQNACSGFFVNTVNVDPFPLAQITPDVSQGCSILTVNFSNDFAGAQPDAIDTYTWEIDAGSGYQIDSVQSPTDPSFSNIFTKGFVNSTGANIVFDIRLRVKTINGCETLSSPVSITVFPAPIAGFNAINYSPFNDNCSPLSVDFEVDASTQSQSPTDYTWTISDINGIVSQQSSGTTPTYNYNFINNTQSIKDYFVTLTTALPGGCNTDSTNIFRVNPVPVADFDIDTLMMTCEEIQIEASAIQKGLSTYQWILKVNGTTLMASSNIGDSFQYTINKTNAVLTVEISLTTINFAGCASPVTVQTITVEPEQIINVAFDVTPPVQTLPGATIFLTNNTNVGPWTYLWDFGDGNTSNDPNLTEYTYADAGTYNVSLTASTATCQQQEIKQITIFPIPPVVDFDYDPAFGCSPLTVNFTNLSQFADPNTYLWNFGDGQGTSTVANPSYTYFEPGIYSVMLSASNSVGEEVTEIKSQIIEVFESPIAQFSIRPTVVFVPDNPIYTKNNSQNATTYFWDFGDNTNSTEAEPIHYYKEAGSYDITLIAKNINGCSDTLTRVGATKAEMNGRLLVPNAFSPNLSGSNGGDIGGQTGTNDIFLPIMQGVEEFEMYIFNRWGELLFKSVDKNVGWDGYYNGILCPQDVYIYKLNLVFGNGQKSTRTGDVNLIR